ncbi:MAG: STAS domain-containing protein [Methylotenera sp.]|nr:STAS domain-containing protein [Methylotenera sp.]
MAISVQGNQWHVTGDVLMDNANAVLQESNTLTMTDDTNIDFSKVSDVDTAALSLIMEWQRRAISSGNKIHFSHLPEGLVSLVALYGVTDFISFSAN